MSLGSWAHEPAWRGGREGGRRVWAHGLQWGSGGVSRGILGLRSRGSRQARGIYAASACEVRECFEMVDAVGWRTVKRRKRRGPGAG